VVVARGNEVEFQRVNLSQYRNTAPPVSNFHYEAPQHGLPCTNLSVLSPLLPNSRIKKRTKAPKSPSVKLGGNSGKHQRWSCSTWIILVFQPSPSWKVHSWFQKSGFIFPLTCMLSFITSTRLSGEKGPPKIPKCLILIRIKKDGWIMPGWSRCQDIGSLISGLDKNRPKARANTIQTGVKSGILVARFLVRPASESSDHASASGSVE
jgi:hypothetical protein